MADHSSGYPLASRLENTSLLLMLFAALRADGGAALWLLPALCGILLGLSGLALSRLCTPSGLHFRRRLFRTKPKAPAATAPAPPVIPFPKAG